MTPGERISMRVKPRELMASVDILKAVGVDIQGVSVSELVRLAFNVLVESAIKNKQIPERDGFEYTELLAPFKRANLRTKVAVGQTIALAELHRAAAGLPPAFGSLPQPTTVLTDGEIEASRARTRAMLKADGKSDAQISKILPHKRVDPRKLRYDELRFRSEQDAANMSQREIKELRKLERDLLTEAS